MGNNEYSQRQLSIVVLRDVVGYGHYDEHMLVGMTCMGEINQLV